MGSPENREQLQHLPGEIVVGITSSPNGRECVGMTYNGETWLILENLLGPAALSYKEKLKENYSIESIYGPAINWRESLKNQKIELFDFSDGPPVSGIYVRPEDFDRLRHGSKQLLT
jgi:hypothetical protein